MSIRRLSPSLSLFKTPSTTPPRTPLSTIFSRTSPGSSRVTTPGTRHGFNHAGGDYFESTKPDSGNVAHTISAATRNFINNIPRLPGISLPRRKREDYNCDFFHIEASDIHVGEYSNPKPGLNEAELNNSRVVIRNSKLVSYSGTPLQNGFHIYVVSPDGKLYMQYNDGTYNHGSFLRDAAGVHLPVRCAGIITVMNEKVGIVSNESGHYKPGKDALDKFADTLFHAAVKPTGKIGLRYAPGSKE